MAMKTVVNPVQNYNVLTTQNQITEKSLLDKCVPVGDLISRWCYQVLSNIWLWKDSSTVFYIPILEAQINTEHHKLRKYSQTPQDSLIE